MLKYRVSFEIKCKEALFIAFGITRAELDRWKHSIEQGNIAYLTHYWRDNRFPNYNTVTKVGCSDLSKLVAWCEQFQLNPLYIHRRDQFPHFDLLGPYQYEVLKALGLHDHISRFGLHSVK